MPSAHWKKQKENEHLPNLKWSRVDILSRSSSKNSQQSILLSKKNYNKKGESNMCSFMAASMTLDLKGIVAMYRHI
jgi:hypothetical protein